MSKKIRIGIRVVVAIVIVAVVLKVFSPDLFAASVPAESVSTGSNIKIGTKKYESK